MKTAISLPDELFERAERLAEHRQVSRSRLYALALEEYLARHAPDAVTEAINRLVEQAGAEVDPFVREAARRRLEAIDW